MKLKNIGITFLLAALTTTAIAETQNKIKAGAGTFTAYNDTDKEVTIEVGDFFSSWYRYTIGPHDSKRVWVSTDNQNIHIKSIK